MSPLAYVHTLRLEEAKQQLEATRLPIEAVAAECGYEDAGYFSRLFTRRVGLTPANYRRRFGRLRDGLASPRSEEHTSELQSLMRSSYAVFCFKKKKQSKHLNDTNHKT